MFNLVIDFNNLLMRSISTPGMTFYNSNFENEDDLNDIVKKLTIDICYNIRLFSPNKVIIVCDSPNAWRKDILPADERGYKANRIKDDTKNWDNLWKKMNKFKEHLSSIGFAISEVYRSEADDLAALWKDKLFTKNNESIIFISSDKDWRQLIDFNKNTKSFVSVFNPTVNNKGRKKLFMTNDLYEYVNNDNSDDTNMVDALFDMSNNTKNIIKNAISNDKKIDVEIVNPFEIVLHKIFEGDAGDNVPSFYEYYKTTKRGTTLSRVTPTQVNKLKENLHINNMDDLNMAGRYLVISLEKIMKIEIPVDSEERLKRQKILVELNTNLFPENIISEFNNKFIELYEKIMPKNLNNIKWMDVLNDTEFLDKNKLYKPAENKVFTDLGGDFNKYFTGLF